MAFWLGILAGALFAWIAMRIGFYETWTMLFNIVISVYAAVFLTPIIVNTIPSAGITPCGSALTLAAVAIGTFLILYGISYTFITGQFSVSLPKIFDTVGAGVLGFLAGFLVLSFAAFLICVTPISQNKFVGSVGLSTQSQQANISYICWWCDLVNGIVSRRDKKVASQEVINELVSRTQPEAKPETGERAEPNEPGGFNDMETPVYEGNQLGPLLSADVEDM